MPIQSFMEINSPTYHQPSYVQISDFLQGSNRVIFPCLTDTPEIRQQKEKLIFAEISNLDDVEFLIALINEDIDSEMSNQDLQNMTIIFARI